MPQSVLATFKSSDGDGVLYVNTLAIQQDVPVGPDSALDYNTMADDIWSWLGTLYLACLHPHYTVNELDTFGILGGVGEGAHAVGTAGTLDTTGAGGEDVPRELAVTVTIKTAIPSRRGRGRIFIPSPRVTGFGANTSQWKNTGSYWTAITALANALNDEHTVDHGGVNHRYRVGIWSRVGDEWNACTVAVPRRDYHFLRSRRTAP